MEAFQQERINNPHYPSPTPQCQAALLGSSALSFWPGVCLPTGKWSLEWDWGRRLLAHLWNSCSRNSNQNTQINFWDRLILQQQESSSTPTYTTACKVEGWQKCPPECNTLCYLLPSLARGKTQENTPQSCKIWSTRKVIVKRWRLYFPFQPPHLPFSARGLRKMRFLDHNLQRIPYKPLG